MTLEQLNMQKNKIQGDMDKLQEEMEKLREEKDKIIKQIGKITGIEEEADGAITTTTAGNISKLGGSGNYAPKIGMMLKRKTKKKKKLHENKYNPYDSHAIEYIDKMFD